MTSNTNLWKKYQRSGDGSETASDTDSSADKENIEDWIDISGNNEDSFDKTEEKLKNDDVGEMKKSPGNSTDNNNKESPIIDRADDTDLNDPDLYGKDWPEEKVCRIHLYSLLLKKDNIFHILFFYLMLCIRMPIINIFTQ